MKANTAKYRIQWYGVYYVNHDRPVSTLTNLSPIILSYGYVIKTIIYNKTMRTTTDKKDNVIRIRINDDMSRWLNKESFRTGISVSQIIRDLIIKSMQNR